MEMDTKEPELKDGIFYTGNKGPKYGVRYLQVFLMALSYSHGFATKSTFSVAMVAMTDNTTSSNPNVPTYDWDNVNVVISAVLWSGIPFTLMAGYLGKQYGPKWFLVISGIINALAYILIPLAVRTMETTGLIICRVVQGVALGFLYPQSTVVLGRWVPPEERSRMGFILSGMIATAAMIASFGSSNIAETWLGWPWIFYIFGSAGFVIAGLNLIWGQQSVETHPKATIEEKKYLKVVLFDANIDSPTPWRKIFTSIHVWAIMIGASGYTWFVVLLTTEFSIFLANVFQFDLSTNGLISALPSLVGTITGVGISILSDMIPNKGILRVVNSRRCFHLVGVTGISVSMVAMTYLTIETRWWSVVLICIAEIFIMVAGVGGAGVNVLDISSKYAGIIGGALQTFASCFSLFAPLVVQWICIDMSSAAQWRTVYMIASVISISTGVFFAVFASDQRQNWDDLVEPELEKKRKSSIISVSKALVI